MVYTVQGLLLEVERVQRIVCRQRSGGGSKVKYQYVKISGSWICKSLSWTLDRFLSPISAPFGHINEGPF